MSLPARYFDGKTSAPRDVELLLFQDGSLRIEGLVHPRSATADQLRISERVGNTPRRLFFEDGALCELRDNDSLDAWLGTLRPESFEHRVFRMERLWPVAVLALVTTLALGWAGIRYGVPAVARHVARIVPASVDVTLGRESLALLDRAFLEPSQLSEAKRAEVREDFARITAEAPRDHDYRLEFRRGGKQVGANAIALPSGIVVITDELIELSQDPNEIVAVLAHEVGHVVNRHALRSVIQKSASVALLVGLTGDFTSISSIIGSTPAVLIDAKYSRELETEADDFSYAWLEKHGIAAHYFGDLLLRLEEKNGGVKSTALDYLSSHPSVRDRIRDRNRP